MPRLGSKDFPRATRCRGRELEPVFRSWIRVVIGGAAVGVGVGLGPGVITPTELGLEGGDGDDDGDCDGGGGFGRSRGRATFSTIPILLLLVMLCVELAFEAPIFYAKVFLNTCPA